MRAFQVVERLGHLAVALAQAQQIAWPVRAQELQRLVVGGIPDRLRAVDAHNRLVPRLGEQRAQLRADPE